MSTDFVEKTISSEEIVAEPVCWLRFLPRWSLMVGLVTLTLPIVFLGGVGQQASDSALGAEYVELMQAVRSPGMFRVGWTLDAVIWLMLGGSLLALAGIQRRHAPIRATFIAACGIAQLFGALGSFLRLNGISDLAARYVPASPDRQVVLLESYLHLWRVIHSSNHIGVLLQGAGFFLAAWGVFSLRGFPRWLAVWLALPGLLAIAQFVLFAAGAPFLHVLNIIGVIAGNIALNFAMTVALWRPSISLVSAVSGESARG
jgi:hypothetical protein